MILSANPALLQPSAPPNRGSMHATQRDAARSSASAAEPGLRLLPPALRQPRRLPRPPSGAISSAWRAMVAFPASTAAHGRPARRRPEHLVGTPFELKSCAQRAAEKAAISRAAAPALSAGPARRSSSTAAPPPSRCAATFAGLELQVKLTNSLHIVGELLPQSGTRISVPGGAIFREQEHHPFPRRSRTTASRATTPPSCSWARRPWVTTRSDAGRRGADPGRAEADEPRRPR